MEILQKEAIKFLKLMENSEFKEVLTSLSQNQPHQDDRKKLSKLAKISNYTVNNLLSQAKRYVEWALTSQKVKNINVINDWAEVELKIGNHSYTIYSDLIKPDKWEADNSRERAERYHKQR